MIHIYTRLRLSRNIVLQITRISQNLLFNYDMQDMLSSLFPQAIDPWMQLALIWLDGKNELASGI